ncbi:hypothetical protein RHMOL_Rhmol06G0311000 [Rhododendron molle]|uniref:Uncharacterized protein n=1 Tax=Rhododendron molle TaxID=49168 RepID=A0ACC0NI14_RHOML|nr:hypothetical protein RHMOL_Rhmol06G0311000 [Rhododendron molle]
MRTAEQVLHRSADLWVFDLIQTVGMADGGGGGGGMVVVVVGAAANSKVSLVRYWKIQIYNDLPKPWFLLNKASPLTAMESLTFSELANDPSEIGNQLRSFCSSADLFCFPDLSPGHGKTYVRDGGDVNVDCCSFIHYNGGKPPSPTSMGMTTMGGKAVKTWVEPGIYFRERMLTTGTIMRMPNIKDKTPKRSYTRTSGTEWQ